MSTDTTTTAPERGAHHVPLSKADKLGQDAAEAARVRSLANHPDVIALRVEKVRSQVDALMWVGIVLGLGFTMVNVQHFAAAGAPAWSLPWLAAWLLDPMVSLVLIAVLRAEQITARYQVATGTWATRTKWFAFASTLAMNTWQSWAALDASGIVLHSVPPVLVLCAAETAPWLRDRLTEATHRATTQFTGTATEFANTTDAAPQAPAANTAATEGEAAANTTTAVRDEQDATPAEQPRPRPPARPRTAATVEAPADKPARKTWTDYLAEARDVHTPGVEPSPAWVRQVTGCGRATSKKVADALRAETATPPATVAPVAPVPAAEDDDTAREVAA